MLKLKKQRACLLACRQLPDYCPRNIPFKSQRSDRVPFQWKYCPVFDRNTFLVFDRNTCLGSLYHSRLWFHFQCNLEAVKETWPSWRDWSEEILCVRCQSYQPAPAPRPPICSSIYFILKAFLFTDICFWGCSSTFLGPRGPLREPSFARSFVRPSARKI